MSRVRVYVAGPYSNPKPEVDNAIRAIEQGEKLWQAGFCPFIPHLAHWWAEEFEHGYEMWMEWSDEWLKRCDAVYVMPGDSPGAVREALSAEAVGIPVFISMTDLKNYFL